MHLFNNKKKDVKQFLNQMKANKTNRSSNQSSLENNTIKSAIKKDKKEESRYHNNAPPRKVNNEPSISIPSSRTLSNYGSNKSISESSQSYQRTPNMNYGPNKFPQKDLKQSNFYNRNQNYGPHQISQYQQNFDSPEISQNYPNNSYLSRSNQLHQHPKNFGQSQNHGQYSQNYRQYSQKHQTNYLRNDKLNNNYRLNRRQFDNRSISQTSDLTIYQSPQYYKGPVFHQQPQNLRKTETMKFPNQSAYYNSKQRQVFQRQQPNYEQTIPNSQNLPIKDNKMFLSQINSFDFPMEEIRQVQLGLSTQKDSPTKLTDLFSKPKQFDQIVVGSLAIKNKFQSQKEAVQQSTQKSRPSKHSYSKPVFSKIYQEQQHFSEKLNPNNISPKCKIDSNFKAHSNNAFRSEKLYAKVSSKEKCYLKQNANKLYNTAIKLQQIVKNTITILSNIENSSKDFSFHILNEKGRYYKYMNIKRDEFSQNQKMQIEEPIQKKKIEQNNTKRKRRTKNEQPFQRKFNNNKTVRRANNNQQIQI